MAAIILGTGFSACYVEFADAISKLRGTVPSAGKMASNSCCISALLKKRCTNEYLVPSYKYNSNSSLAKSQVINIGWGNFWSTHLPFIDIDEAHSIANAGNFWFL
eukprot:TRINITY_DN17360_c0_g1_i10.p1 TRINITY_DN17360_c0_g1~~TRINITY_DN17360_c0_g1_i10.p1  ORF type:complete len:105 (-),score=13.97 TRINITY_DN17360_c0_g1_i10:311-625(-)